MDTQISRTYKLLLKRGSKGVYNYEFPTHRLLRYSHYIKKLRDEYGCHITAERLKLSNGRASNVWVYRLVDEEP